MLMFRYACFFVAFIATLAPLLSAESNDPPSSLWDDLGSTDGVTGYRAVSALVRMPEAAVKFIGSRIKPVAPTDSKQVARLIQDLNSTFFGVRDQADRELAKLAERAQPQIEEALRAGDIPLESRRRLEAMMRNLKARAVAAEGLRQARSVETLELIGTDASAELLDRMAQGAPTAHLTLLARDASSRLSIRRKLLASNNVRATNSKDHQTALPSGALFRLGAVANHIARRAVFTPDGKTLVGLDDSDWRSLDVRTGELLKIRSVPYAAGNETYDVVMSPDGKRLATQRWLPTYQQRKIDLWEYPSFRHIAEVGPKAEPGSVVSIRTMAFAGDGKTLVSADNMHVYVWDTNGWKEIRRFVHDRSVAPGRTDIVAFSRDATRLATVSDTVRVWDVTTGKLLRSLSLDVKKDRPFIVAFSNDNKLLAAGRINTIQLWDTETGKLRETLTIAGRQKWVLSIAFAAKGNRLAVHASYPSERNPAGGNPGLHLWDLDQEKKVERAVLTPNGRWATLSPSGESLAWGNDRWARLLDWKTLDEINPSAGHYETVNALAYSPDGQTIVSGSDDCTVRLWDAATGKLIWTSPTQPAPIRALAISPDGRWLAIDGSPNLLWDLKTRKPMTASDVHGEQYSDLAFSPDGKALAGYAFASTCLLEVPSGKRLGHSNVGCSFAFSTDSRCLVPGWMKGTHDMEYGVGDLRSGKVFYQTHTDKRGIGSLKMSSDGRTLALWVNGETRLIEMLTSSVRGRYLDQYPIAFSPDCRRLLTAANPKDANTPQSFQLHELHSGKVSRLFAGHSGPIYAIAFSPDGRRIVTPYGKSSLVVWDVGGKVSK